MYEVNQRGSVRWRLLIMTCHDLCLHQGTCRYHWQLLVCCFMFPMFPKVHPDRTTSAWNGVNARLPANQRREFNGWMKVLQVTSFWFIWRVNMIFHSTLQIWLLKFDSSAPLLFELDSSSLNFGTRFFKLDSSNSTLQARLNASNVTLWTRVFEFNSLNLTPGTRLFELDSFYVTALFVF